MQRTPAINRTGPQKLALIRQEAARCLPFTVYLNLINVGITTGNLPILDSECNHTGRVQELSADQRMDLVKFAINKFLPDAQKEVEDATADMLSKSNVKIDEIRKLTDEQLAEVIDADFEVAPATPEKAKV